jgi:hypothetical protein
MTFFEAGVPGQKVLYVKLGRRAARAVWSGIRDRRTNADEVEKERKAVAV